MHRTRPLSLAAIALLTISFAACSDDVADDEPIGGADTTSGPKEVRIVKGEHGTETPDIQLSVVTPGPDEVVTTDSVTVQVRLQGVDLKSPTAGEQSKGIAFSADGQHIHVIIDDKPYMAMYDTAGFSVGALSEGMHTLRAFPSRSWHESYKKPQGAFVAHTFYVKSKKGDPVLKPAEPLLTYSRPKGEYKGKDAERILLDFYVSNTELSADKHKVVASIDGQVKDTLTEWVPYFIEGLPAGEHTVKLELIGPDGAVVPGPFNSVEQKIIVTPDGATASSSHAPGAGH